MPVDKNIQLILDANPGITIEEAQEAYSSFKLEQDQQAKRAAQPQVTSGQVLAEENRPFNRGLEAGIREGGKSVEEISQILSRPLTAGMGVLRSATVPGVAFGGAVGTTTQNILSQVPGLGGAGGVIPAGGAAVTDAMTQMFTGPKTLNVAAQGGKALFRGLGKFVAPGAVREAGVEVAAGKMGAPKEFLERLYAEPKSATLFKATEAAQPNVPTANVVKFIDQAYRHELNMATPDPSTINRLKALIDKFKGGDDALYVDLRDEAQRLALRARGLAERNPIAAKNLREARSGMLDAMDQVSPAIKAANRQYRLESATDEIIHSLRSSDAGTQFKKLLEDDRSIAGIFGKKTTGELASLADELSTVASAVPAGIGRQILSVITEGPRELIMTETGRKLLRGSLQPVSKTGNVNPTRIFSAVQLWKAKEQAEAAFEAVKDPNVSFDDKMEALQKKQQLDQQILNLTGWQ